MALFKLKTTGADISQAKLVEASHVDLIWGIGMAPSDPGIENPNNWKGQNLLGFALTEVRDILSESEVSDKS